MASEDRPTAIEYGRGDGGAGGRDRPRSPAGVACLVMALIVAAAQAAYYPVVLGLGMYAPISLLWHVAAPFLLPPVSVATLGCYSLLNEPGPKACAAAGLAVAAIEFGHGLYLLASLTNGW